MKRIVINSFPFLTLIAFFLMACENENVIQPALLKPSQINLCDTANTYSCNIKTILDLHCATSQCHDATTKAALIDVSNYAGSKAIALDGKRFSDAINHLSNSKMPLGKNKLPDSLILKIDKWINSGAPE